MKNGSASWFIAALGALSVALPTAAFAEEQTFEAVAAIAAGSINPPNPVESCNRAKENTRQKAASAGYKGAVVWEKLSTDSDCRLGTEGGRSTGYVYIFTARGKFQK